MFKEFIILRVIKIAKKIFEFKIFTVHGSIVFGSILGRKLIFLRDKMMALWGSLWNVKFSFSSTLLWNTLKKSPSSAHLCFLLICISNFECCNKKKRAYFNLQTAAVASAAPVSSALCRYLISLVQFYALNVLSACNAHQLMCRREKQGKKVKAKRRRDIRIERKMKHKGEGNGEHR